MQDAAEKSTATKPFVRPSELDVASITHTVRHTFTDVQHNGQPYEITCTVFRGDPFGKQKKFASFSACRSSGEARVNEDISQKEFNQAEATPNTKYYVKHEYFAYLKSDSTPQDSSIKVGWIASCSTYHNGQKTYTSSCQRNLCYSPEIDTSESIYDLLRYAYFNALTQKPAVADAKG